MKILSGLYKNRPLKTPRGDKTRPTSSKVRESVFNILQNRIEGARFLDVFAGSGSMGIEALSRGAKKAEFIEWDKQSAACIRENLALLKLHAPIHQQAAEIAFKRLLKDKAQFDIIYIDPPYSLDVTPLLEKIGPLLAPEGILILEQSKRTKIDIPSLKKTDERHFGDTTLHFWELL